MQGDTPRLLLQERIQVVVQGDEPPMLLRFGLSVFVQGDTPRVSLRTRIPFYVQGTWVRAIAIKQRWLPDHVSTDLTVQPQHGA